MTFAGYYWFEQLQDEVKAANGVRSKGRLDCLKIAGKDTYLTNFVNSHGHLCIYKTPAREIVSTDSKRIADWSLTINNFNLSSIFIEDLDSPNIGFGYCNANRLLSNGMPNPMFQYRFDGYLFLVNTDYSVIEILVIPDGRNLITAFYQRFIDGSFNDEIKALREAAKPFFRYIGL